MANNVRGYPAEFLVARAVGSQDRRVEWDAWDVTAPDGTRIEVKSSGFLQAWSQNRLSRPTFQVTAAYSWDAAYEPLDVSQWSFYVAPRASVEAQAGASMGLTTLARVAGDPVDYSALRDAVTTTARRDGPLASSTAKLRPPEERRIDATQRGG